MGYLSQMARLKNWWTKNSVVTFFIADNNVIAALHQE